MVTDIYKNVVLWQSRCALKRSAWQSQFTARSLRQTIRVTVYQGAVTHVQILTAILTRYVSYYHQSTLAVNNDGGSNSEW